MGTGNGYAALGSWVDGSEEEDDAREAETEAMLTYAPPPAAGVGDAGSGETQEKTNMAPQSASQDAPLPPALEGYACRRRGVEGLLK